MELIIFYPSGFLNFNSFRSVILLHLSEHLIFNYLIDLINPPDTYRHKASTLFDFVYFNFSLKRLNKNLYQKLIKSLDILTYKPTILKKYFLREKNKIKNEFFLKEIVSDFQLRKLLFASLVDTKVIEYSFKKSIKILDKISWRETERFIKNNFSIDNFLIFKADNDVKIINYPKTLINSKEIKLKVNFQKFNKKFPFLFIFLYYFKPLPELIFFGGILRRAIKSLIFKRLSDKLYIYDYLDKYYFLSIQKLFVTFFIPYQDKQKLKKEILKAKRKNFFITKNRFNKFKNEFIEAIDKNCFDIFSPYILNKIFKQEIKKFELKNFKKEILEHVKSLNFNQFQLFLRELNFIFNS